MPLYGLDVSEHNNGLNLHTAQQEGYDFAIIRICDGTYKDPIFNSHLKDAETAGLITSGYWYLRAPSEGTTIAQQVDTIDQQLQGRKDLPIWIDVESIDPSGNALLSGNDVWAAKHELECRGYTVPGIYSGAWYWEKMIGGEPSMDGLGALWVSNYGTQNSHGTAAQLYPGDDSPRWNYPLGDHTPDILQYGSNGHAAAYPGVVDINAYRGTHDDLKHLLNH